MPTTIRPPPFGCYQVICPYCEGQFQTSLKRTTNALECKRCKKSFFVFLATVRAKRGRTRAIGEYIIRAITKNREEVLRFRVHGSESQRDMDFRSRDIFYISYKDCLEEPGIVTNVTTQKYLNVGKMREAYEREQQEIAERWEKIRTEREKSKCFIVTATCGRTSREVQTLTVFRDNYLAVNKTGLFLTKIYYRFSPSVASSVRGRNRTCKVIRTLVIEPFSKVISRLFKIF